MINKPNPKTNPNMTLADGRNAGYCVKGCRERCAALGLDWRVYVREGFPVELMETFNDDSIARTLAVTRARLAKES